MKTIFYRVVFILLCILALLSELIRNSKDTESLNDLPLR